MNNNNHSFINNLDYCTIQITNCMNKEQTSTKIIDVFNVVSANDKINRYIKNDFISILKKHIKNNNLNTTDDVIKSFDLDNYLIKKFYILCDIFIKSGFKNNEYNDFYTTLRSYKKLGLGASDQAHAKECLMLINNSFGNVLINNRPIYLEYIKDISNIYINENNFSK